MLRGVLILDAPEMVDILDEWNRVDLESLLIFFFSSRRRHMRCLSDWSSDVCSSDLIFFHLRGRSAVSGSRFIASPCPTPPAAAQPRSRPKENRGRLPGPPLAGSAVCGRSAALRSEERRVGKEGRSGGAARQ